MTVSLLPTQAQDVAETLPALDELAPAVRPTVRKRKTASLAEARRQLRRTLPRIPRNRVGTSDNGERFRYADLEQVERIVMAYLDAYGLDWWAIPTTSERTGKMVLAYALVHLDTGETLAGEWEIRNGDALTQAGQVTILTRQALKAVTGAVEESEEEAPAPKPVTVVEAPTQRPAPAPAPAQTPGVRGPDPRDVEEGFQRVMECRNPSNVAYALRWIKANKVDLCPVDPDGALRQRYNLPARPEPVSLEQFALAVRDGFTKPGIGADDIGQHTTGDDPVPQ